MAIAPNTISSTFLHSTSTTNTNTKSAFPRFLSYSSCRVGSPVRCLSPMASLSLASPTIGISETFAKIKSQGKVAFIPYICAGDPDLSTTSKALKILDSCGSDIIELGMPYSDPLADGPVIQVAFIPYICAGDPGLSTTSKALKILDSCGSDIIELGMPYSDPLADGPVIQAAATRALAKGTNFDGVVSMLKEVVPQISCPIALFTYYNPILKQGTEKFMSTIRNVGVHGLVVPDVPLEETAILREEAAKNNVELVLLTTPTTPTHRMKAIVEASEGFVYLVSSIGVTGARASVSERVQSLLQEIKEATNKPVAVGFGISKPEQVKQVAGWGADGVIVGSAVVKILGETKSPEEALKDLETFTRSLTAALP